MYANGEGVPQDFTQAFYWTRKAADQGNPDAQANLGMAYFKGDGVERDFAEAAKWLREAADQGSPVAQRELGLLYEKGQGVPQDYVQAASWYSKASRSRERRRPDEPRLDVCRRPWRAARPRPSARMVS